MMWLQAVDHCANVFLGLAAITATTDVMYY